MKAFGIAAAAVGLLVACGESSGSERRPTPTVTATATGPSPSRTAAPTASGSAVTASAGTSTPATSAPPSGTTRPPTTTTTSPGTPAKVTRLTPAGTHAQDVSGTVRTSLGEEPVDPDGEVVVGSPNGATQTISISNSALVYDFTQRLTNTGLRASRLHLRTALFDVTYAPPDELLLPSNPRPGDTWGWSVRSTDGGSTLTFSGRYVGTRTVDVAGTRVTTHRLDVRLRSRGNVTFDSTSDQDLATTTLLPVFQHTTSTGTSNGVSFATDISAILRDASGT